MKSLRTDLIILALIISGAVHFGVMYYFRPRVMTHIIYSGHPSGKKGPMRVVRAPETPEPVSIAAVEDVQPKKAAPEAEKNVSAVPVPDAVLPTGRETAVALPELTIPEPKPDEPLLAELPEVKTVGLAPLTSHEPKIGSFSSSLKPTDVVSKVPVAGDDALSVPVLKLPMPGLTRAPSVLPGRGGGVEIPKKVTPPDEPAFTPPKEVMERVDEKVVKAEKDAVRELVDVPDAKELDSCVSVTLSRCVTPEGIFFRAAVAPKPELATIPKDVVVLIDASGSIGRERMGSIRGAAKRILRSAANTGDRFNLVAFRDRYTYAFRSWQECTEESFNAADRWLSNVATFGRTDVFATISSVLTLPREPTRPLIALVVTDGEANAGVSGTADILSRFTKLNDGLVSIYMYGVKSSANRELIDVLTRGNRGESFVFQDAGWFSRLRAGDGLEGLSNRFRDPVLSDLRIIFATDCKAEAYPRLLRNLYRDGKVEIIGRVPAGTREIAFSLKGLNGREAYEAFFRLPLASAAEDPSVSDAWNAERTIDARLR